MHNTKHQTHISGTCPASPTRKAHQKHIKLAGRCCTSVMCTPKSLMCTSKYNKMHNKSVLEKQTTSGIRPLPNVYHREVLSVFKVETIGSTTLLAVFQKKKSPFLFFPLQPYYWRRSGSASLRNRTDASRGFTCTSGPLDLFFYLISSLQ